MKRKILFFFAVLFIGTWAMVHAQTRITLENTSGESIYFQPEDSLAFNKIGTGTTVMNIDLKKPKYYRFIDKKSGHHSVFVQPGNTMMIIYDGSDLKFSGDNADTNKFLQNTVYICSAPEGIASYSPEWVAYNKNMLEKLYDKLDHSGLSPEFIAIHKQYLNFSYLNQRLIGPQMMQMFGHNVTALADNYYDFLKELHFDDANILYVPKWFNIVNTAFEEMEKRGLIPVSNTHYMKNYASKIADETLRSHYLVELLGLTLKKGYSDDFMLYLEDVKPLITDKAALEELPGLVELYNQARERNKAILRGMPMPDFMVNTVDGKEYKLSGFKGKVLVLDFWFTGCIPCKAEMPFFDKLAEELQGEPVQFISISLDTGDQLMALWRKMMAEKDSNGPVLNVNLPNGFKSEFAAEMNIRSVPRIVLVDKEGNIVDAYAKRPSDPKLKQQIKNLLDAEVRIALNAAIQKMVQAKSSSEREKVLNEFIREKGQDPKAASALGMMYFYYSQALAAEGKNEELLAVVNKVTSEFLKRDLAYVNGVTCWENKNTATAEILARQAVELTEKIKNGENEQDEDELKKYPQILSFYGTILIDQDKVKEATPYILKAYEATATPHPDLKLNYLTVLMDQQKYVEAKPFLEELISDGMSNEKYEGWLEKVYKAEKGTAKGYKEYLVSLKKVYEDTLKEQVTQGQLNEVAPLFTLKNAKGENVSLTDLKGKIVLLDFWATWCSPCKKSFPAMQKVVNKYKKDKEVVFLFIDTWEKDQAAAVEFLKKNNYDFELLYDTEKSDTAKDYKLKGIPAKIIIDKNGIIRYSLKGFSGSDEKNMMEVSAMIESLR